MSNIVIYTDGASRGNPGPGGWGSIVIKGDVVTEIAGSHKKTTNNRMELTAVIESLKLVHDTSAIVFTDSSYVMNGITKWVYGWQNNNWHTKTGSEVLNKDLWEQLVKECSSVDVSWQLVSGHAGIMGNERCDSIATAYADATPIELFVGKLDSYAYKDIAQTNVVISSLSESKKIKKSKTGKAYSYASYVNGIFQSHKTWDECKLRVENIKGARFKKTFSQQEEDALKKEWTQ